MSESPKNTEQHSDTGEFVTDEFDRAMLANQPVRKRRRRKRTKSKSTGKFIRTIGVGLFCAMLIAVGVLLGLSYQSEGLDAERYRIALEARQKVREQWLIECNQKGHVEWTCNRFDRSHFVIAEQLDEFRCDNLEPNSYHCQYTLGEAKVVVVIPTAVQVNGEYRAPRSRAHAIIGHSDQNESHFVTISEKGFVEIRTQGHEQPLIIINPSTGTMNSFGPKTQDIEAAVADIDEEIELSTENSTVDVDQDSE